MRESASRKDVDWNIVIECMVRGRDVVVEHKVEVADARVRFRRTRTGVVCEAGPVTMVIPIRRARALASALGAALGTER